MAGGVIGGMTIVPGGSRMGCCGGGAVGSCGPGCMGFGAPGMGVSMLRAICMSCRVVCQVVACLGYHTIQTRACSSGTKMVKTHEHAYRLTGMLQLTGAALNRDV